MAYDLSGTAQAFNTTSSPVSSEVLSLAVWVHPDRTTATEEVFNVSAASGRLFALQLGGATAGDPVRVYKGNDPIYGIADTAAFGTSAFQHLCGVFTSTTSRRGYLDAVGVNNTQTVSTGAGTYRIDLGSCRALSHVDGRIAEAAIWNAALTDAEVTSLYKGFKPYRIRPQSLVFYAPMVRNVMDCKGGLSITTTGSPAVAAHPRVY
jgi:hypothetical protein